MPLNHLNLTVTDVTATRAFLQKYFGMVDGGGNNNIGFLRDENGMVLTLTSPKVSQESEVRYPGAFHIGFIQPSEEAVNALHQQLVDDGFDAPAPSRQHGSWTFYFSSPWGITIEVLS